jgi:hypothetical protein
MPRKTKSLLSNRRSSRLRQRSRANRSSRKSRAARNGKALQIHLNRRDGLVLLHQKPEKHGKMPLFQ